MPTAPKAPHANDTIFNVLPLEFFQNPKPTRPVKNSVEPGLLTDRSERCRRAKNLGFPISATRTRSVLGWFAAGFRLTETTLPARTDTAGFRLTFGGAAAGRHPPPHAKPAGREIVLHFWSLSGSLVRLTLPRQKRSRVLRTHARQEPWWSGVAKSPEKSPALTPFQKTPWHFCDTLLG